MSETGATQDQLLDAAQRLCGGQPEDVGYCWPDGELREFAAALVPPGYQIVPAGVVTLSAEEAAAARECVLSRAKARSTEARGLRFLRSQQEAADEAEHDAERYRALAAKLSGGAS